VGKVTEVVRNDHQLTVQKIGKDMRMKSLPKYYQTYQQQAKNLRKEISSDLYSNTYG
jgi:hypothetical protein